MVDLWRGCPVTNNQDVVAERQAALHSVVPGYLHPEQARVEIAALFVIAHLIRDVIKRNHSGYVAICRRCRACWSGTETGRRRRRDGQAPNELPPGHLSLFEVLNQLCDDAFHRNSSSGSPRGLPT